MEENKDTTAAALVADYLAFLAGHEDKPKAAEEYQRYLLGFLQWSAHETEGRVLATEVFTKQVVRSWEESLKKRKAKSSSHKGSVVSDSYRKVAAAAMRGLLKYAAVERDDLDLATPFVVSTVKIKDRARRQMLDGDMAKLRRAYGRGRSEIELRNRALVEVLWSTGGRASEIVGLKDYQVNLERKTCEVLGKNDKSRVTFLSPEAIKALKDYQAHRPKGDGRTKDEYVFRSTQGLRGDEWGNYPITARQLSNVVKDLAAKAKLDPNFSTHWTRHGCLTNLSRRKGYTDHEVQTYAGHASPSTTAVYLKSVQADLAKKFFATTPKRVATQVVAGGRG